MISSETSSSGSGNNGAGGSSVGAAASVDVEDVVGVSNSVSDSGDHDGGVVSGRGNNDGNDDIVTRSISAMEEDTKT